MTLPDYAKFVQLNLTGLLGKNAVLSAKTYHFLHFGLENYVISWGNINKDNKQFSMHSGSAGTFFCHTLIDKGKNLAYIIVANSATAETQKAIMELLDKMRKKYGK